ncbi:MAG TPA: ParB/RepB/Spo0J family partition protein, partial [Candidatus Paceibacterota bacterium]
IKTRRIRRFKKQPRTRFSKLTMNELIVSIKSRGQIMPILVRRIEGDPDYDYELIEGERRLRACLFLNIEEMKASIQIVENVREQYTNSFVANFQREPHTPLETGRGIKEMMDYPEHRDLPKMEALAVIAGYVGKTAMWAYGYLQLLDLPEEVQLLLEPEDESKKALPQAMGRFLLTIKSREIQLATCKKVVSEDLSVSEAKHFARRLAAEAGVQVGSHNRTPNREYLILRNCLRNAKTGLEQTLTMPHRTVDELFLNRDLADRNDVLREIDDLSTLLEQLRAKVTIRKVTKTA